jgi:uncharacterized protein with PQ loop repeat
MTLHEITGWLGSGLFAICAIPQAWQSFKDGHSNGLNWFFLGAWFFGELFTIFYIWPDKNYPLLFNYTSNMALLLVMAFYKFFPRKP